MKHRFSVVIFGSGPVALQSFQKLQGSFDFEAIVTKPASKYEMSEAFPGARILSASRRLELDALCLKQQFRSPLGIVIDFGVIIDDATINRFPLGIINSHFSLLPEWRGVDPITFAILSGQQRTGVSLMRIVRAWDEGPLLAQAPYDIPANINAAQLTEELISISDALLKEVVPLYLAGDVEPQDQLAATIGPKEATYSRKLTKEDGRIDWRKPAAVLEREVRAYITWPHSYTTLANKEVIITRAQVVRQQGRAGTIAGTRNQLLVYCGEDALEILSLKPAGKREMSAAAFLAGYGKSLDAGNGSRG